MSTLNPIVERAVVAFIDVFFTLKYLKIKLAALALTMCVYAYANWDQITRTGVYVQVKHPEAYEEFSVAKLKHAKFKEIIKTWEGLNAKSRTDENVRLINKDFLSLINSFKRYDYRALQDYDTGYLFVVSNAAICYTVATIWYSDLSYSKDALEMFKKAEDLLVDPDANLDESWVENMHISFRLNIFKIHLYAYMAQEAIARSDDKTATQYIEEIGNIARYHGGISDILDAGYISNGQAINRIKLIGL